jgi:hypothetical protein
MPILPLRKSAMRNEILDRRDWEAFATLRGFVRLVLLVAWDPIGILGHGGAMDEYDRYVEAVVDLLASGATHEALAAHLEKVQVERMECRIRAIELEITANKLMQVYEAWEYDHS